MARPGPLVHLIDAPIYIFRAYYSLPAMQAPDGTPTHAAYGFANSLLKYLAEQGPSHLAVTFDHSMESFRNELEPGYKAQRGEPPDDLEPQFEICERVSRALGLPTFACENYEADDVIAALASQVLRRGGRAVILSSDKDLAQLVREDGRVTLYDLARDRRLDADGVRERYGVDPGQIPDYLGLVGDSVDNLPGVPGIGPKSARAALRAFGRIEEIPGEAAGWEGLGLRGAGRLAGLVAQHRERALRTRELATLVRDVPGLRADLRGLRYRGARREAVEDLFAELGWGRIVERIPSWA